MILFLTKSTENINNSNQKPNETYSKYVKFDEDGND